MKKLTSASEHGACCHRKSMNRRASQCRVLGINPRHSYHLLHTSVSRFRCRCKVQLGTWTNELSLAPRPDSPRADPFVVKLDERRDSRHFRGNGPSFQWLFFYVDFYSSINSSQKLHCQKHFGSDRPYETTAAHLTTSTSVRRGGWTISLGTVTAAIPFRK